MDNHVLVTQADLEPIRAAVLHLSQTVPALNQVVLNSSTQVARELHTIRVEITRQSTITDQHHRAYLTINNNMVDNIAELQDRIMDFAHRHPLEMLQGDVTVLREQIDEVRKQAAAGGGAENDLRQLREVVQKFENRFTGIEQLVGDLGTRLANYEGQIDELTHAHGLQQNEINRLKTELAALKALLINAGLIETNIHADIRKWIDKFNEPQACHVGRASTKLTEESPQPVVTGAGTPLGRTSEAEGPALGSALGCANINNPAVIANPHTKKHEYSSAIQPQPSTTTLSFRAGLDPEAPSFNSTSSPVLNLRGEDSTAELMSNPANAAKGGADRSIKKQTQGLEHSIWALGGVTAHPAPQQEPRQPMISSASSVSPVLNLRGGDSAASYMAEQTQGLNNSTWAPGTATGPYARKQEPRQPITSSPSSVADGDVPTDNNWSAGLRQSMWAPQAGEANRREARQPKISRAVPIIDPHGKPVSGTVLPGRQGTDIVDSTSGAPISPGSSPFAGRSSASQEPGHRAYQATIDDAGTTSSTATAQSSTTTPRNFSNTIITDNTAQFIADFHRLIQQYNFTITQAAAIIYREAYGAVDGLGEGGPNTTDNSQLASNFAGLVLLDDNAHVEHVQSPVTPIGVKKESRPLNLKTEIEGALRFTEQLDRNKATSVDQGGGGEDAPGEVKSMNTEDSTASRLAGATTDASRTDNAGTNKIVPNIVVSTARGPVTVDGNASITFHNVKYKVKANGNYGNKPTYMVGHLHKAAFDHISINLTFTVARGKPPEVAITAATADETLITITFIIPVYVQTLGFIKRIANDPTVFAEGSEPMNELRALKTHETGVIPGHLRKIEFTYNTSNLDSALVTHKGESELRAMEPSEANMHRFFAAITDWQGGAIEALFTDEENDARIVDEILGAFEALYVRQ